MILKGINKNTRPNLPNKPILKASFPEKSAARITCAISCKLVPDHTPYTSGDIAKMEYFTVYISENIVPISATIPMLIAESFSLDFNIGETAAIASAQHTPVPNLIIM